MRRAIWTVAVLLAACSGADDPTDPGLIGDPALGQVAFMQSCTGCHANGAGFDLAYFGFPASDIVRRALDHVDEPTARDIAAYIASLNIEPGGTVPPFQPGGAVVEDDARFWIQLFGADAFPDDLTPGALRALDLRTVRVPLRFAPWSSETDETDWMPRRPLPDELLEANGGALAAAIAAYHAAPGMPQLLEVVARFEQATPADAGICQGHTGAYSNPIECFEARRWMSAFTAVHILRYGPTAEIPLPISRLWWATGQAAIPRHFLLARNEPLRTVSTWLYLGFIHAPSAFEEDGGYLGQFLQSDHLPRLAMLTALRRMVAEDGVHLTIPSQIYRDMQLATIRAPEHWRADVLEFALPYILERAEPLDGEQRDLAKAYLAFAFELLDEQPTAADRRAALELLHDRILERLNG